MTSDDHLSDDPTVARPKMQRKRLGTSFVLRVTEGPSAGKTFSVDGSEPSRVLLGKGPACAARLDDPHVSRRHAALQVVGDRLKVTDLDSTNGTFVGELQIGEARLVGGEQLRLGSSVLKVERSGQTAARPSSESDRFGRVLGASAAMQRLYPLCERLAASTVPVVIEGETGTGKEQLAEALHELGPRAHGPFVVLDCTAVAPTLVESELFGHERGAFTGSVAAHRGVFERAHGGTLLVDEIGDLPLELQPKLLRAIERGSFVRVGGESALSVDVRLIAATRRDLDREVQVGRFRDDLFHRMAVARIELPPLSERKGDVAILARQFAADFGASPDALPADLLARWESFDWPGNVRELKNAVLRWLALGELGDAASRQPPDVPRAAASHALGRDGDAIARILARDLPLVDARAELNGEFERRYVEHMLEIHGGNAARAAAAAGVALRHFYRLKARGGSQ